MEFLRIANKGFEERPEDRKPCVKKIKDIKRDEIRAIAKKMKTPAFSECRMLNKDSSLKYRIAADLQSLNSNGISSTDLVDKFRALINEHRRVTTAEWRRVHGTDKPTDLTFESSGIQIGYLDVVEKMPLYLHTDVAQVRNDLLARGCKSVPEWKGKDYLEDIPHINREWSVSRRECSVIEPVPGEKYLVFEVTWGGSQICPFHPEGAEYRGYDYGSHDYMFYKLHDDTKPGQFFLSELSLHMIERHDFYGDCEPYRVDPTRAASFVNIKRQPVFKHTVLLDCERGELSREDNALAYKKSEK